jgi:hypothetical protein
MFFWIKMVILLYFSGLEAELETKIKLFSSKLAYSHSFTEDLRDFANLPKIIRQRVLSWVELWNTVEHRNNAKSPMR